MNNHTHNEQLLRGDCTIPLHSTTLKLQLIDCYEHDTNTVNKQYQICLFCITTQSLSVCVKINNYFPYFYVKVPPDEQYEYFVYTLQSDRQIKNKIHDIYQVQKRLFEGYREDNDTFVKLCFNQLRHYNATKWYIMKHTNYTICDTGIPPMLKLFHENDIKTSGWIEVRNFHPIFSKSNYFSSCQYEIEVNNNKDIIPLNDCEEIGPILIASFDIETSTNSMTNFPIFTNKNDKIVQIGTTVRKFSDDDFHIKYIATLGECDNIDGAIVQRCETETELIITWTNFMRKLDPDIITGYNIFGYDYQYIFERAMSLNLVTNICNLSRIKTPLSDVELTIMNGYNFSHEITGKAPQTDEIEENKQEINDNDDNNKNNDNDDDDNYNNNNNNDDDNNNNKNNKEDNEQDNISNNNSFKSSSSHQYILNKIYERKISKFDCIYVRTIGRVNLDLLKYCQENGDRLSSYKLDNVAKHYGLAKGKDDMPYKRIFEIYRNGTSKDKKQVAEYCIQDCNLCNELITKLNVIPNCIGMSSTCYIPLNFLFIRGQGIKIYSLLLKECNEEDYVIPYKRDKKPQFFRGGEVLTANKGFHSYPVSVLDFASLYPSCMISHNLCVSTKLTRDQIATLNLNKDQYNTVEWMEKLSAHYIINMLCSSAPYYYKLLNTYPILRTIFKYDYKVAKKQNITSQTTLQNIENLIGRYFNERNIKFFDDFGIDYDNIRLVEEEDNEYVLKMVKRYYFIKACSSRNSSNGDNSTNNSNNDDNSSNGDHINHKDHRGIIPKILQKLLNKRNETKKLKSKYERCNPFLSKIYDGLQLSYKITANSVYGQLGANFGAFSDLDVAASCTATGRQLLQFAQNNILKFFYKSDAVYGDTDSVFIKFDLKYHDKNCSNHYTLLPIKFKQILQIMTKNKVYTEFAECKEIINSNCTNNDDALIHDKNDLIAYNDDKNRNDIIAYNNDKNGNICYIYAPCNCTYITNNDDALMENIRLAQIADQFITSLLPYHKKIDENGKKVGVHQLEYEKTYQPLILFAKKKYVGKLYVDNPNKWKIDSKGIVLTRRDNCKLLKIIYNECMNNLLNNDINNAIKALDNALNQLLNNHYQLNDFVITKTLKAVYKNEKQPHCMLAKRVQKRDPGNAFKINERIPYCFIEIKKNSSNNASQLQGDMVETPEYIKQHHLKLNFGYYIQKQLMIPILQLFEIVNKKQEAKTIFQNYLRKYNNKKNGLQPINKFFIKKN